MATTVEKIMDGTWIDSGVVSGNDYAIQCLTGDIAEAILKDDPAPLPTARGIAFTTRNGINSSFGLGKVWLKGDIGTIVTVTT